jgi:hypothetical protein
MSGKTVYEAVVLPAPLQPPMLYGILFISICKNTQEYSSGKMSVAMQRKSQLFSAFFAENSNLIDCSK